MIVFNVNTILLNSKFFPENVITFCITCQIGCATETQKTMLRRKKKNTRAGAQCLSLVISSLMNLSSFPLAKGSIQTYKKNKLSLLNKQSTFLHCSWSGPAVLFASQCALLSVVGCSLFNVLSRFWMDCFIVKSLCGRLWSILQQNPGLVSRFEQGAPTKSLTRWFCFH